MDEPERGREVNGAVVHIHDLPDPILHHVFTFLSDVRSRHSASLVCSRWRQLDRSTRSFLTLRGDLSHFPLPPNADCRLRLPFPNTFPSVSHLDLSNLSPWGSPLSLPPPLLSSLLTRCFPALSSLSLYSRDPSLLPSPFPSSVIHLKLVRFHQRPPHLPLGSDLAPFLASHSLLTLDLSQFYCWREDIPAALSIHPAPAACLTMLDLRLASACDGFRSSELSTIAAACPNLHHLVIPAVFNPRYVQFIDDSTLLNLAEKCPCLTILRLIDVSSSSVSVTGQEMLDAAVTVNGLDRFVAALPRLEELSMELKHSVRDAAPAVETLGHKCTKMRALALGGFQGVCNAKWLHLDGIAVCGQLRSLSIKDCQDLTDASLAAIGRGCLRLERFEIHGCRAVKEAGIRKLVTALQNSLIDVSILNCQCLSTTQTLSALKPIRHRIERLYLGCAWSRPETDQLVDFDVVKLMSGDSNSVNNSDDDSGMVRKKRRLSFCDDGTDFEWLQEWSRLRILSLWLPAGELLTPLPEAGLQDCPQLEEITIKVEGVCCSHPTAHMFGLTELARYPKLTKIQLDLREATGYALTAPAGHMDLSCWERFYLNGINQIPNLYELDYWPPQDPEVNQRSVSLPAVGLIRECLRLRKLFIHGTAHEHFMDFFLEMPNLRDAQLREDYYPAPEDDMSTEMRVDSCSRFEARLNNRKVPD